MALRNKIFRPPAESFPILGMILVATTFAGYLSKQKITHALKEKRGDFMYKPWETPMHLKQLKMKMPKK